MSLTAYLNKRMMDLLDEKRVVVWYDGEKAFEEVAQGFRAPNCTTVLAADSRLRARRRADEILCGLNDVRQPPSARNGNLLIYCPWSRGRTPEQKAQDPFEGFALVGSAFGDKEAETLQSLARQAMPNRASEIDRLFREARPNLGLIEGLGEGVHYPLLQEALGSDSLVEVTARLLCRDESRKTLADVAGANNELLRLLQTGLGFVPPARVTALESILEHLGRYVLLSEFALDIPGTIPDQLTGVPRATSDCRDAIYSVCERMRASDDTRDGYVTLAGRVEQALRRLSSWVGSRSSEFAIPSHFRKRHSSGDWSPWRKPATSRRRGR